MRLARASLTLAITSGLVLATAVGARAAQFTGPDVSSWNHPNNAPIDWTQVRQSGQLFTFVKATENTDYTNPYFSGDWAGALNAGLFRGAYHFAQPQQPVSTNGVLQARYFVSVTGTMHGDHDLPPVLDIEVNPQNLSPSDLLTWVQSWLSEVQRLTGRQPMVYTNYNFWQQQMGGATALSNYRLWFARYTNDPSQVVLPGGWQMWTFWQYTDNATVPGITGPVDLSRYCCAYANLAALGNGSATSPAASNPFGNFEGVLRQPGGVLVSGWTLDPDTTGPINVDTYVDAGIAAHLTADLSRPDVASVFPGFGPNHGFSGLAPVNSGGRHTICTYAINYGYGSYNPALGCKTVTVNVAPFGNLEAVQRQPDGLHVSGWAIDPDVADPIRVDTYVDGRIAASGPAGVTRNDVGAVFAGYGPDHGFTQVVPTPPAGTHTVCSYGINAGPGNTNPLIGCRTVTVTNNPFGNFEAATPQPGGVQVSGWVIDPDTANPVTVHVYVDGVWAGRMTAGGTRNDVAAAYPGYGADHGFTGTVGMSSGRHTVCVYGINQGPGTTNPRIGCRTVTVS